MLELRIIGKKGSNACKVIRTETGIRNYRLHSTGSIDGLINYGLTGDPLRDFLRSFPKVARLPILNKNIGHSKLSVVRKAEHDGIRVPKSKTSLLASEDKKKWIEKRYNSIGGHGICFARGKGTLDGKYYQEFIPDRVYELRVHAFKWLDKKDWEVQKRHGDKNQIAWNFSAGGHFTTVHNPDSYRVFREAKNITDKVLSLLGMDFGAADFLVNSHYELYFIEINSAPGLGGLSDHIYCEAFEALKNLTKREFTQYLNRR